MTLRTRTELLSLLREDIADKFSILRDISNFAAYNNYEFESRDLLIRLNDKRDEFLDYSRVLDNLLREAGLFNYIEEPSENFRDAFAFGAHIAPSQGETIVFHARQAAVYHALRRGSNVVLSAPTSFGKSLIIESYLIENNFKNVVIIVPTLALIDQTRRRLTEKLRDRYKIITSPSQTLSEKNIFVLTQERFLEMPDLPQINFWVVDEFYKISGGSNDSRSQSLNLTVYKLLKSRGQFYLIGPNMGGLINLFGEQVKYEVFIESLGTVSSDVTVLDAKDPVETTLQLCKKHIDDSTLIFCSSPKRAADLARILQEHFESSNDPEIIDFYNWCGQNYGRDWHFTKAVRVGIGVHHGRIPRSLSSIAVDYFNQGKLKILVCTSTLIEVSIQGQRILLFLIIK